MGLGFISQIRGNDRNLRKLCLAIFFSIFLIVGLSVYKDYGISWDENIERDNGIISLNYVAQKFKLNLNNPHFERHKLITNLDEWRDRRYPVAFNLPLAILESTFKISDEQKIYQFRHLMTFLVFLCGVYAVFLLAERRYSSWKIGLLAATFLILSPRFFAESFYNSKDLVLLAMFAITTNTVINFLLKPSSRTAVICALATAISMDVRLMAIVFPVITLGLLFIKVIKHEIQPSKFLFISILYLCLTTILVVLMWPWLWSAPWERFIEALKFMVSYRFDAMNFFQSRLIKSDQLPWYYLPVWIGITTPIVYLGLFFVGLLTIVKNLWTSGYRLWANDRQLQDLIFLGLSVAPVLAVMAMGSVLYDGWRHMYFIYPAFLLIAVGGWIYIWKIIKPHSILKIAGTALLVASLTAIGLWTVKAHPLQNVYFNLLAGSNWYQKYDVDYWGLSNKQVLSEIARLEKNGVITIWPGSDNALQNSLPILPPDIRGRIVIVNDESEAKYIVTNFRGNLKDYQSQSAEVFKVFERKVGNESIVLAYRRGVANGQSSTSDNSFDLRPGSALNFSSAGTASTHLLRISRKDANGVGWSYPESWGVWSDGDSGLLYLGHKTAKIKGIKLKARPFLAEDIKKQVVGIYVNGHLQNTLRLSRPEEDIEINLDNVAMNTPILIEFKFHTAVRPTDKGLSDDARLLSLGLISGEVY